ncbi:MAG: hypothetical protein WCJ71_08275, partial [Candidatus Omnitrophota bacterium]
PLLSHFSKRDIKQCMKCSWLCALPAQEVRYLCEKDPVYEIERKVVFVLRESFELLEWPLRCENRR